jgi:hypothetical protein
MANDEDGSVTPVARVLGAEGFVDISVDVEQQNIVVGVLKKEGMPYVSMQLAYDSDTDQLIAALKRAQEKIKQASGQ